jgi:hypothetical protein
MQEINTGPAENEYRHTPKNAAGNMVVGTEKMVEGVLHSREYMEEGM